MYIYFNKENNKEGPKNIFAKGCVPNWSEEAFLIKKFKNTVPWTYFISDLNGYEIVGTFYRKELQKANQKEFRAEKVINRKGNKLFVKWKGYDNYFNSWIDKKDSINEWIFSTTKVFGRKSESLIGFI